MQRNRVLMRIFAGLCLSEEKADKKLQPYSVELYFRITLGLFWTIGNQIYFQKQQAKVAIQRASGAGHLDIRYGQVL